MKREGDYARPVATARRERALRLLEEGCDHVQVAEECGYTDARSLKQSMYHLQKYTAQRHTVFYMVQTVPELPIVRIKFGFTGNLQSRITEYRRANPTMLVLRTYPCPSASHEREAMEAICRWDVHGQRRAPEVHDFSWTLEEVLGVADSFFSDIVPQLSWWTVPRRPPR